MGDLLFYLFVTFIEVLVFKFEAFSNDDTFRPYLGHFYRFECEKVTLNLKKGLKRQCKMERRPVKSVKNR